MAKNMDIIGTKIVGIREMTVKEQERAGLDCPTSLIVLENGISIFALRDEEGNGPGVLIGMKGQLQIFL